MQHILTVEAVKIKTQMFTSPSKLLSNGEMAAAVVLGYIEAGIPMPEYQLGGSVQEMRERFLADCRTSGSPFAAAVEAFHPDGSRLDQDMLEIMRLARNGGIG